MRARCAAQGERHAEAKGGAKEMDADRAADVLDREKDQVDPFVWHTKTSSRRASNEIDKPVLELSPSPH